MTGPLPGNPDEIQDADDVADVPDDEVTDETEEARPAPEDDDGEK